MSKKMYDEATRKRWQEATHQAIKDGEDHARRIWRIVSRVRLRYGALLGKFLENKKELRATKHTLWMARALWAKRELKILKKEFAFHNEERIIQKWRWVERKCLEKAKEYE